MTPLRPTATPVWSLDRLWTSLLKNLPEQPLLNYVNLNCSMMKQQLICLVACLLAVFTGFGQLVDASVETFYTDDGSIAGYPAGHTTYRIYGVLADGSDALTACFGASDDLLELGSTTTIWNSPLGGVTGPDLPFVYLDIIKKLK